MRNLSALLVLTLLISTTCRKPEDLPLVKLDPEFLSFINFKDGSYWIYRDSASGELDSSVISRSKDIITMTDKDKTFIGEYIEMYLSIRQTVFHVNTYTGKSSCSDTSKYQWGLKFTSDQALFYFDVLYKNGCTKFITNDSLKLNNGSVYYNVIKYSLRDYTPVAYFLEIDWAKDIGIIKIYFGDGTIYELEKYNIIR